MPSTKPTRRAALSIALCLTIQAGCAPTTATVATEEAPRDPIDARGVACRAFAPIGWSSRDTDATIRAVKSHNAVHDALCGDAASGDAAPARRSSAVQCDPATRSG